MYAPPYIYDSMLRISRFIEAHPTGKTNADSFLFSCKSSLEKSAFSYVNSSHLRFHLDDQYKNFIRRKLYLRAGFFCELYSKINRTLYDLDAHADYHVTFLDGDSHNKGQRPILLQCENEKLVLKITDPRTSLIYNSILYKIYAHLCIPSPKIKITYDRDYSYQITPYLQAQPTHTDEQIENYARCLGAHLATSYLLKMTDLHIENVITSDGYPHIVDTECMLYDYYDSPPPTTTRLVNTGLISPKKTLSGICGGDTPVLKLDLTLSTGGSTRYIKNQATPTNRISDASGKVVPISNYKKLITESFSQSYEFIANTKNELLGSINPSLISGVRTRFLVRTTAHYKTVVDRIYSPSQNSSHDLYLKSTLAAFKASGHIPKILDPKLRKKEIMDILAGDIPFFWACPQGGKIMHRTGEAMNSTTIQPFRYRLKQAISSHSMKDLEHLYNHLETYL